MTRYLVSDVYSSMILEAIARRTVDGLALASASRHFEFPNPIRSEFR